MIAAQLGATLQSIALSRLGWVEAEKAPKG